MTFTLERLKPLIFILIPIILVAFWPEARTVQAKRPNYNDETSQCQSNDKSLAERQAKVVSTCRLIPDAPKFDLCYLKHSVKKCVDYVRQTVPNVFYFYYNQCCNAISKSCPLIFKCQFCPLCFMNNDYIKCFVDSSPDKTTTKPTSKPTTKKPSYNVQTEQFTDCDD